MQNASVTQGVLKARPVRKAGTGMLTNRLHTTSTSPLQLLKQILRHHTLPRTLLPTIDKGQEVLHTTRSENGGRVGFAPLR